MLVRKNRDDVGVWLDSDPTDKFKGICKWCSSAFTANTSTIEKHCKTSKHLAEQNQRKSNTSISRFVGPSSQDIKLNHKKAVSRAELVLSGCFAAHNIPMRFIDHLTPSLKLAFRDSSICKDIEMKRMKCTRVITNVIGASHKEDLREKLRNVKFSALTDESTPFNVKTAAIAVRFYDRTVSRIVTRFWDLSDVFPKDDFEAAREARGR
ncbi:Mediator of RNA polymerase II transcription subunit 23 [Frankliniella fusca]|uniref:Mediator of RNA polymerase II transcription subunit 23 n=1 Tax=Frankliniella fusca TaxID=407009 RepID=A0AAE1H2R9_9NEOP|nr:Mediator of RNA polymerase II transcription subunit 23 [Frankliniella fusca]